MKIKEGKRDTTELNKMASTLEQREAELALINSVQEGLAAKMKMGEIYKLVGDKIRDFFDAQVIVISTFHSDMEIERIRYLFENGLHIYPDPRPVDRVRQKIIKTQDILLINERAKEVYAKITQKTPEPIPGTVFPKSLLFAPLILGKEVLGCISLQNIDREHAFTDHDVDMLKRMALSVTVALENALIYQAERRRADEQKALLDTMADLSQKLELNLLLDSVLERTVSLLGVTGGELAIYDDKKKILEVVSSLNLGMKSVGTKLALGEGAMGKVAQTHESLIIPDYQNWEGRSDKYQKTTVRGVMGVPLIIGNKLVGALCSIHLDSNRTFDESDLQLLNMFAPLAATAIQNAQLFDTTNRLLEEAKRRATELKETQEQLVQQEKLASLGQLTAGIAHEIKNPLNFVNNFSDLSLELIEEAFEELEKYPSQSKEVDDILRDITSNLRKIYEHGSRADSIVKSMLEHSRGGTGEPKPTDLNSLIKEFVNLSFHGMRAGTDPINVDIKMDLDESIKDVPLIAEDFSRVIVNLCDNAFDAMREKQHTENYEPKLTVKTFQGNDQIIIEIGDNGQGIPQGTRDKIMQPFFTTKKGTQGTGLGLSITNDIIKAHGGALDVESKNSKGSTFIVRLPHPIKKP